MGLHGTVYPHGEVQGPLHTDQEETFTTYTRDKDTGLDYAKNRYYTYSWGRFLTADPYDQSAVPSNPASWNRFGYTVGDPLNLTDPEGLQAQAPQPVYYCDPEYEGVCVVRVYIPYDPGSTGTVGSVGDYAGTPRPETKEECDRRVRLAVEKKWQRWRNALGQRVWKAMKKGAITGGFAGMLFGLGPELPSGWIGLLAGGVIGADTAAMKELTFEEAWMYLVERNSENSEYNADAQVQKQCGNSVSSQP